MELKSGYKQTEVGVIPEDWQVRRLGKKATFRTGPFGSALHKSDYTVDGIPVINPMHIMDGELVPSRTMTVTEDAARQLAEYRLRPGDIVIGRRGDMGRCAVVQGNQAGWLCGTGSLIIRCAEGVAPDYLQRVLSSATVVSAIEDASVGSTMINLNQGVLGGLSIQFPLPEEQHAIAAALSDVDALLVKLDTLIAKKRDLKQAAMQQLLTGKQRLPEFSGEKSNNKQAEAGAIPEGWVTLPIFDIVVNIIDYRGRTPRKLGMEWGGGDIPALSAGNVKMGYIDFAQENYSGSEALYKRWMTNGHARKNDIVFTMEAPLGNVALIPDDRKYFLSQRTILLQTDSNKVVSQYLLHLMTSRKFQNYLSENSTGSTATGIQRKKFEKLKVLLPRLPEQRAIAAVLSDMDAEIEALEARREKTRALKQGMMQELLTGRIRLL